MSFDHYVILTQSLLGWALMQQSLEHLAMAADDRYLFGLRLVLGLALFLDLASAWICLALLISSLIVLYRLHGPYNGGSDRMGLLILSVLLLVHIMPSQYLREVCFGYLALQLTLSYVMSGVVKIANHEWRNGLALQDVFRFSAYPVTENLRALADWPRLILLISWAVIIFELCFPVALIDQSALMIMLMIAAAFHLANALLFGLNRFFWVWLAAFPSIIWLQERLATA